MRGFRYSLLWISLGVVLVSSCSPRVSRVPVSVPEEKMREVFEEVKTPFKYGLVLVPGDPSLKVDCPTVFRHKGTWWMTFLVFDGRGYETWLAKSGDLLHWEQLGRIMAFSDSTDWDGNQKAGFPGLQDPIWGGSYKLRTFNGKYWMPYFGGNSRGYEKGLLSFSMAFTRFSPASAHRWERLGKPILKADDADVRWWENSTIYKTWVLHDKSEATGYPFVLFYNARGDSLLPERGAERIGMAVSRDMIHWTRYGRDPVINHHMGISGDAVVQKMGDLWVMFYFGAFWPDRKDHDAFNRFACSRDLVHWTEWSGEDLIAPSEPYDDWFAHKSCVVKYRGIVYHFYCAVNRGGERGIALATSAGIGKSTLRFPLSTSENR
ncbi:MAG TPA: hypothetical protein PLD74_02675 [Prolixibacteraceae bacterium]|nr:glycosylase [Bacteroidales bacterium]OQB80974.1 MAG: hypothetical protein BWX87_00987 [Bacteroidetes bacterium ADurb.Bin123]HQE51240.1 hypothetical protein [Prolixibacteraceae bacterium]